MKRGIVFCIVVWIMSLLFAEYRDVVDFSEVTAHGWGRLGLFDEFRIVDLNADGIKEMINKPTSQSMNYWEQSSSDPFHFDIIKRSFLHEFGGHSIPTFVDLDHDGLRELIVSGHFYGDSWIIAEETTAHSLDFEVIIDNYGGCVNWKNISEFVDFDADGLEDCFLLRYSSSSGYYLSIYEQVGIDSLNIHCVVEDFFPDCNLLTIPVITDIDNDGLFDVLFQKNQFEGIEVYRFEQSTANSFDFTLLDIHFLDLEQYVTSCYSYNTRENLCCCDINNNGLLNIVVRLNDDTIPRGSKVIVLEQIAVNSEDFVLIEDNIAEPNDVYGANVALYDLDADSCMDMFTAYGGSVYHYEQVLPNTDFFECIDTNFNGIEGVSRLVFYDLDNDGLMEMVVDQMVWEQVAVNSYDMQMVGDLGVGAYVGIDFADLDGDGLLDMLLGFKTGDVYHLTQSENDPYVFEQQSTNMGNNINGQWQASPRLIDIDNNGKFDLLMGSWDGYIRHLEQNDVNSFVFDMIDSSFLDVNPGYNSSLDFADIDSDGFEDVVIEGSDMYYLFYQGENNQFGNTEIPKALVTLSNHPNPFNPTTEICFSLSSKLSEGNEPVAIEIFNIRAQKVKTISIDINKMSSRPSGARGEISSSTTWDGTDSNNRHVASGVYFYQLKVGSKSIAQKKMMLLK